MRSAQPLMHAVLSGCRIWKLARARFSRGVFEYALQIVCLCNEVRLHVYLVVLFSKVSFLFEGVKNQL